MKDCVQWDLGELSRESGISEVEIAKTLFKALVIKAEVYGIPQRIEFTCKVGEVAHKEGERYEN